MRNLFKVNNKETRTTSSSPSIDNFKHKFACWIPSVYFEVLLDTFKQFLAQRNSGHVDHITSMSKYMHNFDIKGTRSTSTKVFLPSLQLNLSRYLRNWPIAYEVFTCSKSTIKTTKECANLVKVNNEDNRTTSRTTSLTLFWCLYC